MGEVVFSVALKEGGEANLRQLCEILNGHSREKFDKTRRTAGAKRIRWWIQHGPDSRRWLIYFLEADDPQATLEELAATTSGLNKLINNFTVEAVGFDPRKEPPRVEQLLAWDANDR